MNLSEPIKENSTINPSTAVVIVGEHSPESGEYFSKVRHIARIIFVIIHEFFAALVAGALSIMGYMRMDPREIKQEASQVPILFLHGVNHNQSGWIIGRTLLRRCSKKDGFKHGPFYSINYAGLLWNGRCDTFGLYADRVFKKVVDIYRKNGQMPIIVGHSMGGIIATKVAQKIEQAMERGYYINEDGSHLALELSEKDRELFHISRIITLGTPFYGSYVADKVHWFFGKVPRVPEITVYKEMRSDPELCTECPSQLQEIRHYALNADKTGRIKYFNVGSTLDELVPRGYFVTEDPHRQYELDNLGHIGLMLSRPVWYKVHEWLKV